MKKVLIIEDSNSMRMVYSMVVKLKGYEPVSAENGQQGMELFEECKPALIFLDLMMPVMDGRQFINWLRNDKADSTPIILMSAALTDDIKNLLQDENMEMLRKPVQKQDILDCMDKLGL